MTRTMRARLGVMMFLHYFSMGALVPVFGHYLKNYLHFSPAAIGIIAATPAACSFLAPFVAAQVADRWISSHRLLGLCHGAAGAVMLVLSQVTSVKLFFALYVLYALCYVPTSGLTNAVALHHVTDPKKDFGPIRVWGTLGWFAVAWIFGYWWIRGGGGAPDSSRVPQALIVCGAGSWVLALYCFTLPNAGVKVKDKGFAPWKALKLFARPPLLVLCVLTLFASVINRFYYDWMGPYLVQRGVDESHIMPLLSIGQIAEVGAMFALGWFTDRFGIKATMIIGAAAHVFRYFVMAYSTSTPWLVAAVAAHGICWTFYFITAYVYVDTRTPPELRAAGQQFMGIIISGAGSLLGSLIGGQMAQYCIAPGSTAIDFTRFWMMPAWVSLAVTAVLWGAFRDDARN
ncbi:MAG: xanthosine permease [Candidatus Hydrogenedentota bacterium]